LRPLHGARIELELEQAEGAGARYALRLKTAEGEASGEARIDSAGNVDVSGVDASTAIWVLPLVRALLRMEWRDRKEPGAAPWPRRITRWREAPSGR
jgi:hypothetical protein